MDNIIDQYKKLKIITESLYSLSYVDNLDEKYYLNKSCALCDNINTLDIINFKRINDNKVVTTFCEHCKNYTKTYYNDLDVIYKREHYFDEVKQNPKIETTFNKYVEKSNSSASILDLSVFIFIFSIAFFMYNHRERIPHSWLVIPCFVLMSSHLFFQTMFTSKGREQTAKTILNNLSQNEIRYASYKKYIDDNNKNIEEKVYCYGGDNPQFLEELQILKQLLNKKIYKVLINDIKYKIKQYDRQLKSFLEEKNEIESRNIFKEIEKNNLLIEEYSCKLEVIDDIIDYWNDNKKEIVNDYYKEDLIFEDNYKNYINKLK